MISAEHFDPARAQRLIRKGTPLQQILVEGSSYSRTSLKRRLFDSGLKDRRCELCGQNEIWRGVRMPMILDHINGVPDDNRLENLRIACPNCAATFETHCGRKNRLPRRVRECARCGQRFPRTSPSSAIAPGNVAAATTTGTEALCCLPGRSQGPPYEQLIEETADMGFSAVGRKYGVSGNAVRKWIHWYEAASRAEEARREAA